LTNRVELLTGRIARAESRTFKDHIVLIGTNSTNLYIAERLKETRQRFVIVTSDKIRADKLRYNNNYLTYVADATSDTDMKRFQLEKAKSIIIDVKDSSRTIYVLLVAKEIAKDTPIVVIAPSDEAERHIKSLHVASNIINPSFIAASEISKTLFKK
jgi:Trk K+ transport system NAD-binding subunit